MTEINNWNYGCLQNKQIGLITIVDFDSLNSETLNMRFELFDIISQ